MAIISFHFEKNLWYPLSIPFGIAIKQLLMMLPYVSYSYDLVMTKMLEMNLSDTQNIFQLFYHMMSYSIGLLYALIPLIIIIRRQKSVEVSRNQSFLSNVTTVSESKKNSLRLYCHLCILGILSTILQLIEFIIIRCLPPYWYLFNTSQTIVNTVMTVLLCYFWFGTPVYRQTKIALVMMIIILVCFVVFTYIGDDYLQVKYLWFLLIILLSMIVESIREVYEKHIMENYIMTSFGIMVTEGICGLILTLISFIFTLIFNKSHYYITGWFSYIFLILFSVFSFIVCHLRLKSNELFHPVQRYSFSSLSFFIFLIGIIIAAQIERKDIIDNSNIIFLLLQFRGRINVHDSKVSVLFGFVFEIPFACIWLISTLIINEIVILHCCGLDANTRNDIIRRGILEDSEHNIDINNYYTSSEMIIDY